MRVFTAITLPQGEKAYLEELQNQIIPYSLRGNYTAFDNFHLTLRFIGELQQSKADIVKAMEQAAAEIHGFTLETGKLGSFTKKNKLILWLGLTPSKELNELYNKLEENMAQQGFQKEPRPYRPHITLGREVVLSRGFERIKDDLFYRQEKFSVEDITLMESTRVDGKLAYVPLHKVLLQKPMENCNDTKNI